VRHRRKGEHPIFDLAREEIVRQIHGWKKPRVPVIARIRAALPATRTRSENHPDGARRATGPR
jgi:hypothetical protein